jgi:dihydrofolate synthase / folylpolyglutamate synthase
MMQHPELEYLFSLGSRGWKLGLDTIRLVLSDLGNPHQRYKTIHVAGTNGKGSTCAMLNSMLIAAGYRTGLYTSPHLIDVTERIRCNGIDISYQELIVLIQRLKPALEKYQCTFFEALTAIGFLYFAEREVDIAVIEVGLGGRLDATNVIMPILSIITEIEHDHVQHLGRSREKIALEKGGIIKRGVPCNTNTRHKIVHDVLWKLCHQQNSAFYCVPEIASIYNSTINENGSVFDLSVGDLDFKHIQLSLLGDHQIENAALALTTTVILNQIGVHLKKDAIYQGLRNVYWPGRLQLLTTNPRMLLDVAHNANGVRRLVGSFKKIFPYRKATVLLGVCNDKNYHAMLRQLNEIATEFIFVKPETERAISPRKLAKEAVKYNKAVREFRTVSDGVDYLIKNASERDLIIGTGSHYTVGEILKYDKKA